MDKKKVSNLQKMVDYHIRKQSLLDEQLHDKMIDLLGELRTTPEGEEIDPEHEKTNNVIIDVLRFIADVAENYQSCASALGSLTQFIEMNKELAK